jgi:tripartite-type tricarboxylate transporter receptor subunit TctC
MRKLAQVILFGAVMAASTHGARADAVADFFKGKSITIMIGYGAGGSDDLWARLLGRHMNRFMPGGPTVVPQNVPGAGSLVAANQAFKTAPKDGTVMALINRGVPFEPLLGNKAAQFDPRQFNYIGSPDRDTIVAYVRTDGPVQKLSELRSQELIVAATGSGADSLTYPIILRDLFHLKLRIVQGYPGSRDMNLAVERGEAQGTFISYDTALREPGLKDGTRRLLVQGRLTPDPRIKDVPGLNDLDLTPAERKAAEFFLLRADMGRPFVAPPGVPADRLAALRKAFRDTLLDAATQDDAVRQGLNVSLISPDELMKTLDAAYRFDEKTIDMVRTTMQEAEKKK